MLEKNQTFFTVLLIIILSRYVSVIKSDIEIFCREKDTVIPVKEEEEDEYADSIGTEDNSTDIEDMNNYLIVQAEANSTIVLECTFW